MKRAMDQQNVAGVHCDIGAPISFAILMLASYMLVVISFNGGANAIMSRVELLCFSSTSGGKTFDTLETDGDSSQGARLLQMHIIHQGNLILSWYSKRVMRIMKNRATLKLATSTTHFGISPTHFCSLFTCKS